MEAMLGEVGATMVTVRSRRLAEERQRWEADLLREQMEEERAAADLSARKAEELAAVVSDRDAAARALVHSNSRLALLSDTANRLLMGQRPHAILTELFQRLTGHLDLDLYVYRRLDGDELIVESHGGLARELVDRFRMIPVGEGLSGKVASHRQRLIIDDANILPNEAPPEVRQSPDVTAC